MVLTKTIQTIFREITPGPNRQDTRLPGAVDGLRQDSARLRRPPCLGSRRSRTFVQDFTHTPNPCGQRVAGLSHTRVVLVACFSGCPESGRRGDRRGERDRIQTTPAQDRIPGPSICNTNDALVFTVPFVRVFADSPTCLGLAGAGCSNFRAGGNGQKKRDAWVRLCVHQTDSWEKPTHNPSRHYQFNSQSRCCLLCQI